MHHTADEVNRSTGRTKVSQYGWGIKDQPGALQWLPKAVLIVDASYQREARLKRVLKIAQSWSHIACGVIVVAKRSDGRHYVIDGQHRVAAACKRADIQQLPCIVFETTDTKQEAAGFVDANTLRRMPTTVEKWRALLLRGDSTATFVDALITNSGRTVSASAGVATVRCLSALTLLADQDRDALARVWPLITDVCLGQVMQERIPVGLCYIETHLPQGESLVDKRWRERVLRVGYQPLLEATKRASSFYQRGGAKIWGQGMVEALNKGTRIPIVLVDSQAP